MSLFQRIRTPFSEAEEEVEMRPPPRTRAVGELLRARREQLELDLDPIGEVLRIRPAYLAALEQGRIEELPGPAYAMGFVRAYANHLGLDGDRVLARYKADIADVQVRPDLSLPVPLGERSLPGGPILLVGLILALCGYGTWYYLSTGERARPDRVAAVPAELQPPPVANLPGPNTPVPNTAAPPLAAPQPAQKAGPPPAADTDAPKPTALLVPGPDLRPPPDLAPPAPSLAANPLATVAGAVPSGNRPGGSEPIVFPGSPPGQSAPTVPQPPAAAGPPAAPAVQPAAATPTTQAAPAAAAPVITGTALTDGRVAIRALADCWIQVRAADQTIVFSRVLKAGEIYHVPGRTGLSLRTGNAGALAIEVDGKPAPAIGAIGTLRRNVALDPEALVAGTAVQG